MNSNPYSPEAPTAKEQNTPVKKITFMELLIVVAIVGIVVGLALPGLESRPHSRRMSCANNLRQLQIAIANYETVFKSLPPVYTTDSQGNRLHSWRTLLLPYLEQKTLYDSIDLSKPWDHPVNANARNACIPLFHCPSSHVPSNMTHYVHLFASDSVLPQSGQRRFSDIADPLGHTLLIYECNESDAIEWMNPSDPEFKAIAGRKGKSPHETFRCITMADGSIHYVTTDFLENYLEGLVTANGAEEMPGLESSPSW